MQYPQTATASRPSRRPSQRAARPRRRPSRGRATPRRSSGVTALIAWEQLRRRDVDPDRGAEAGRAHRAVAERAGLRLVRRAVRDRCRHQSEALAAGRRPRASVPRRARRAPPTPSRPPARAGVPANPPSCQAMTDAFVYSGVNGAVRRFAGQDATTHVAAQARDHRVPEAGGSRPLPELLRQSRDLPDRPLQERTPGRLDRRRPTRPEAWHRFGAEELGGEDRGLHLDAQGCRRRADSGRPPSR